MFEPIASPVMTRIDTGPAPGRVVGVLATSDKREAIERVLILAPQLAQSGEARLLSHADVEADTTAGGRQRDAKLEAMRHGRLKRYVLRVDTGCGPRIIKIAEVTSVGNVLLGMLGSSVSRKEHTFHLRAQHLGLAATRTLGFLEWRAGPKLMRACQVQTLLPEDAVSLATFLARQLSEHGQAALDSLAQAMAQTHRAPFFHADLKGFHAFVDNVTQPEHGPATYTLRWIDLARVSFHLSRRQRIINLYQALRFVVPPDPSAQERFVTAYCQASGWYAAKPERALARVRRFLAYKYRTHPIA